ncbi:MAG: type I methionyl aminopeptidase [Clostridia bacterium]|nr:type I methionyl aminopeptidase [Clostridia bacterium]
MIVLKTSQELTLMKAACQLSAQALQIAGEAVKPGVSTWEIDKIAHDYIVKHGGRPNFLGYAGYPATACISVNHQVIHGIPSKKVILKEGDIVSIDLGAQLNGYQGDNAATFAVGVISPEAQRLMDVTEQALYKGIEAAISGGRIGDISAAVQQHAEGAGFSVVRQFVGHGIGTKLHEEPEVPNFGKAGRGVRLIPGMTLAIEPMINMGTPDVRTLSDGWTVETADKQLSAHFEHTIAITSNGPVILTRP